MALFQVCVNIDPMQTVMTVRDDSGQVVQRSVKPPRWGLLPEGAIDLIKLESALIELGYRRPPTADWVMGHWSARTVAEPAQRPEAATTVYDPETLRDILGLVSSVVDSLDDPEVRRRWFVEVCRRGVVANFQNALETQHWQNYVVAKAASISYDGGLRESLEQAIRASENAYAEGMAGFYEALGKVLGRRVKTDFSDGGDVRSAWVSLAHTGAALMEGMVLRNAVLPNAPRDKSDPFGTGDEAEWAVPAVAFTGCFLSMTEPDPTFDFGAARGRLADAEVVLEELIRRAGVEAAPLRVRGGSVPGG